MSSLNLRRGASLAAVMTLAVGGAFVAPGAAFAVPAPAVFGADVQVGSLVDLDPSKTGSITIHKYLKTDANGTVAGNGQPQTVDGTPVPGVVYKVERLSSIDLTTQAGWEKLAAYNNDVAKASADGVTAVGGNQTTDGNGTATFASLPLGAYVVTEVSVPAGYTASDPFIVTVPMTNANDTTKWDYDPDVYPKNPKVEVKKTVEDTGSVAVGSKIAYTVKSDIPQLSGDQKLNFYQVVDQYDSRLTLDKASVKLALTDGTALAAGTDYELVYVDTAFDADGTGAGTDQVKRVTAVFTEAGRAKILAGRKAADGTVNQVVMTLGTTVSSPIGDNGLVKNTAFVLPDQPTSAWDPASGSTTPPPDTPSAEVVSKYGKIRITKTGTAGTEKLQGAEFQVFKCTGPTAGTANFTAGGWTLVDSDTATSAVDPITVNGAKTFTTGADGTVSIDALQNNDWENNAAAATPDWYCLVETKAPTGYELQTKPVAFQVLQSNSTADNKYTLDTSVKNVSKNGGFTLPLTGAAGIGVLGVAGGLLVGGAIFLAARNRRRSQG